MSELFSSDDRVGIVKMYLRCPLLRLIQTGVRTKPGR